MDAIYTPSELAQFLAAASSLASPGSIADFAAGDGALLRAAAERWPEARLFGSDIDETAVLSVRSTIAGCEVKVHDLLADGNDSALDAQTFDLILLNPPFSCRGNTRFQASIAGQIYSASKALAFVARALKYLSIDGELIAILPASVLVSERDAELISAIRAWGSVEQIGEIRKNAFRSHAISVTILRISRSVQQCKSALEKPLLVSLRPYAVEISRGSLSVHDYVETQEGPRFIHTTDMKNNRLAPTERKASAERRSVHGPAVLISRVGRPSKHKVVQLPDCEAVLSDCVIALKTVPAGHEQGLAAAIAENWETFKAAYGGSCAPYTTLKRLAEAFLRIGIVSSVMADDHVMKAARAADIPLPIAGAQSNKQSIG